MHDNSFDRRGPVTRRDVLRILAAVGATGALGTLAYRGRSGTGPVTRSRVLMGTVIHLTVLGNDPEEAEGAAEATLTRMARLESLLSRYREGSEVSVLNRTGRIDDASDALLDVLRLSDRIHRLGDGAFDLTVQPVLDLYRSTLATSGAIPTDAELEQVLTRVDQRALTVQGRSVSLRSGASITPDGIAKGYVVDRGVDVLRERGFTDVFVEAGGDLVASGGKGPDAPWKIGIRRPRPGLALQASFDARDRAVATSGDYMQPFTSDYSQHHILDPRSGRSAPELASATVVAPDAATADGLATLTMVLGAARGRELLEDLDDCEGFFITKTLETTRTTGFRT